MGEDEVEEREKKNRGREEVLVGKKKGCLQEASMRCSESDYNNNNHNASTQSVIYSVVYIMFMLYIMFMQSMQLFYSVIAAIQQAA